MKNQWYWFRFVVKWATPVVLLLAGNDVPGSGVLAGITFIALVFTFFLEWKHIGDKKQ
jgi:hypothetical protein